MAGQIFGGLSAISCRIFSILSAALRRISAVVGGQVIEDQLPVLRVQGVHLPFLDHPYQGLVPRVPVQALLLDDGQRMAGLAGVVDLFAAPALGKAAVFFGLPGPRRSPFGRRRGWGENSPSGQRRRDDRGREEPPWPLQDAYTAIRCMELFM